MSGSYPAQEVIMVKVDLSPDNLKAFFLAGAAATYASGKLPVRPPERPWMKRLTWVDSKRFPGLTYVDEWFSSGGDSAGSTVLLAEDDPLHPAWYMAYGGACKDEDEGVLWLHKTALRLAYEARNFCGGRGSTGYKAAVGGRYLMYQNRWRGDFAEFDGGENIVDVTYGGRPLPNPLQTFLLGKHQGTLFWHWVHGGLMGRAKVKNVQIDIMDGDIVRT